MRTHYENLKVPESAPLDAVKASYRKLCLQHHPDRNLGSPGAQRIMQIINDAYEVLSDPEKRRDYDLELALQRAQNPKQDLDPKSPEAWKRNYKSPQGCARTPQAYPFYPGSPVRAEGRFDRSRAAGDDEKPKFFVRTAVRVVVFAVATAAVVMWILVLLRSTSVGPHMDPDTLLTAAGNLDSNLSNSGLGYFICRVIGAALSIMGIIAAGRDKQNKRGL